MSVPLSWLRDYVAVDMPLEELASASTSRRRSSPSVEQRGVPDVDGNLGLFRVGRVSRRASTRTRTGSSSVPSTSARASRPDRLRRLELRRRRDRGRPRPARCSGGLEARARKLRGEMSGGDDPVGAELELGHDHSGIIVLDGGEPGTPLGDVLPLRGRRPRPRDHREPARPPLRVRRRARGGALFD